MSERRARATRPPAPAALVLTKGEQRTLDAAGARAKAASDRAQQLQQEAQKATELAGSEHGALTGAFRAVLELRGLDPDRHTLRYDAGATTITENPA